MQLDQLKLNFVAIASHELRTPATSVYGVLTTLVARGDELPATTRATSCSQIGVEQGERLRRLLEELLDLSRLDARAISVEPRPLVLASVARRHRRRARCRGGGVELDVPDDLAVVVDPLVLERVVSNLAHERGPLRQPADPDRGATSATATSASPSRTAAPGVPEELEDGSSTASRAAATRAAGSVWRSRARTPRRTAATSSTTRARAAPASSC